MTNKEISEIVIARYEGCTIQYCPKGTTDWRDCKRQFKSLNLLLYNYRVKPKRKRGRIKSTEGTKEE